jgi:hypothetical protein
MSSLPLYFKKLFWDIDFSTLEKYENKEFIIERVLEFGDIGDFEALKKLYSLEDIKNVLKNSRNLSFKSANFYALILEVSRKGDPLESTCRHASLALGRRFTTS